MTLRKSGTSVATSPPGPRVENPVSDKKTKNASEGEWKYPMTSEPLPKANPPPGSGVDPQAKASQRPGGAAPGAGESEMSDEAKNQWAGAKGPAEGGKP